MYPDPFLEFRQWVRDPLNVIARVYQSANNALHLASLGQSMEHCLQAEPCSVDLGDDIGDIYMYDPEFMGLQAQRDGDGEEGRACSGARCGLLEPELKEACCREQRAH